MDTCVVVEEEEAVTVKSFRRSVPGLQPPIQTAPDQSLGVSRPVLKRAKSEIGDQVPEASHVCTVHLYLSSDARGRGEEGTSTGEEVFTGPLSHTNAPLPRKETTTRADVCTELGGRRRSEEGGVQAKCGERLSNPSTGLAMYSRSRLVGAGKEGAG